MDVYDTIIAEARLQCEQHFQRSDDAVVMQFLAMTVYALRKGVSMGYLRSKLDPTKIGEQAEEPPHL